MHQRETAFIFGKHTWQLFHVILNIISIFIQYLSVCNFNLA